MSCSSSEQVVNIDCGATGESCCQAKPSPSYWWVWVLLLLIIVIALAIVFRDKIQLWWFAMQGKFNKQPVPVQQRPTQGGMPPQGMMRRPMGPPPGGMPQRQVPVSPRPFPKDNELDATLKKLKGM